MKEIFMAKDKNFLINHYLNFIELNVLPIFKKRGKISEDILEIIKYNISVVLECCGKDKNYFETQKKFINRKKSVAAIRQFRKEFGISEDEYNDAGLEKRLIENNLDIYKTFGKMFG